MFADFGTGAIVRNTKTGQVGVVCPPLPNGRDNNNPNEVNVAYDGFTWQVEAVDYRDLVLKSVDAPVADFGKCGAANNQTCCIFFEMREGHPHCQRFTDKHWSAVLGRHLASRTPNRLFPDCQLP